MNVDCCSRFTSIPRKRRGKLTNQQNNATLVPWYMQLWYATLVDPAFHFQRNLFPSSNSPFSLQFIHLILVLAVTAASLSSLAFDLHAQVTKKSSMTPSGRKMAILHLVSLYLLLLRYISKKYKQNGVHLTNGQISSNINKNGQKHKYSQSNCFSKS